MSKNLLTTWSDRYVDVLFRSELALHPRFAKFRTTHERGSFIAEMAGGAGAGVRLEPLADGLGIKITGAGRAELLGIVKLARQCGGEILFPGALPG